MSDILTLILSSIVNWLHLLATIVWIGAMTTNIMVLLPSLKEALEPTSTGKLMDAVMKRFRIIVYICVAVLGTTGILMSILVKGDAEPTQFESLWNIVTAIKIIFTVLLVVLAFYSFENLSPKVAKLAAKGPSPELGRLQKRQMNLAATGLFLGITILLMTGILTAI